MHSLSVRQVTGWICRHPDNLIQGDTEYLQEVLNRCLELRTATELVRSFADMLTHLHGERVTDWITAAEYLRSADSRLLSRPYGDVTAGCDHQGVAGRRETDCTQL
ncbi:hypothetical protein KZZ52_24110 [Dactylosporangium sp. AC04546]|uniref:hypothetical protein n=1 Tax=Dactylosporangium sp. AC04546 TaxID=2862460 RepID=UPI001EDF825C|nr:hypothetical protein [Dactylosporangium sp. AC04546]WVK88360.1 hypothetical protein KZZ52_24110 [Dactylosporangium sp. AC04546]